MTTVCSLTRIIRVANPASGKSCILFSSTTCDERTYAVIAVFTCCKCSDAVLGSTRNCQESKRPWACSISVRFLMNELMRYFDLYSRSRGAARGQAASADLKIPVGLQYLAAFLGVIASPFLIEYQQTGVPPSLPLLAEFGWDIFFGLIIAFVLLPYTYKKVTSEDRPNIVQLAAVFSIGLGWQSIVSTILG